MTMLTAGQVTEIAATLEDLRDELRIRRWSGTRITAVMTTAAGNLVSIAAMRAPVPQQAYFPQPPPYPYQLEDFSQNSSSVPLQITVTGSTRQEMEERAHAAGRQVFGEDAMLTVTLAGTIQGSGFLRGGETQYQCGALVRVQEDGPPPSTWSPVRRTRESDVPLG